jgi:hypothetical protein
VSRKQIMKLDRPNEVQFAEYIFLYHVKGKRRQEVLAHLKSADPEETWSRVASLAGAWRCHEWDRVHGPAERQRQNERYEKIAKLLSEAADLLDEDIMEPLTHEWADKCWEDCRREGIEVRCEVITEGGIDFGDVILNGAPYDMFKRLVTMAQDYRITGEEWDGVKGKTPPRHIIVALKDIYEDETGELATATGPFLAFIKQFVALVQGGETTTELNEWGRAIKVTRVAVTDTALTSAIKRALA